MSTSEDVVKLNESFKVICDDLYGLNYVCKIKLYPGFGNAGRSLEEIVSESIGDTVKIGGSSSITTLEAIEDISAALNFRGDESSHPDLYFLDSQDFSVQSKKILRLAGQLLSSSNNLIQFWLKSGHPFYPVFWDFAFISECKNDALVWIGSSSD